MKKISLEAAKLIAAMDDIRRETETQADSLQDNLEQVQSSLEGKMSYAECESKIQVHVRRLVDQIKGKSPPLCVSASSSALTRI